MENALLTGLASGFNSKLKSRIAPANGRGLGFEPGCDQGCVLRQEQNSGPSALASSWDPAAPPGSTVQGSCHGSEVIVWFSGYF